MLTSSTEERQIRADLIERKKSNKNDTKILIDNVILAIKINTSMSSVQEIHEHMEKYLFPKVGAARIMHSNLFNALIL